MAKKINKEKLSVIVRVSLFWLTLAGVVILVQSVDKSAEKRGQLEGYTKAATTIQSLCK